MASNTFCVGYFSGDSVMTLTFNSAAECAEWNHGMTEIKDNIKWINKKWYPFPRVQFYKNHWIPMVEAFEKKWGSNYVSADIKSSLAEVKKLYPLVQ